MEGLTIKTIPLTQGKVAIVDDKYFEQINQHKWYALKSGNYWYAVRYDKRRKELIYMHRVILGNPKGFDIDHIDRNGLNNQKANLRQCTKAQNQFNTLMHKRRKKSQYKGLSWEKRTGKWVVRVHRKYIGSYADEIEAARTYDQKAKEIYGTFAYTNF